MINVSVSLWPNAFGTTPISVKNNKNIKYPIMDKTSQRISDNTKYLENGYIRELTHEKLLKMSLEHDTCRILALSMEINHQKYKVMIRVLQRKITFTSDVFHKI